MDLHNYEYENQELEAVDSYVRTPHFQDSWGWDDDLTDSSDESINNLLKKYSFDERPDVYLKNLKLIGDHLLTHLEDIDSDTLSKIFTNHGENNGENEILV